jgi:hypothetical protein
VLTQSGFPSESSRQAHRARWEDCLATVARLVGVRRSVLRPCLALLALAVAGATPDAPQATLRLQVLSTGLTSRPARSTARRGRTPGGRSPHSSGREACARGRVPDAATWEALGAGGAPPLRLLCAHDRGRLRSLRGDPDRHDGEGAACGAVLHLRARSDRRAVSREPTASRTPQSPA